MQRRFTLKALSAATATVAITGLASLS
ncbi:MAG: hypothetical protein JWQ88_3862, partial [Rhodoferax sp.]|nr:hypothetical protein [Rhodoferax sp.]